MKEEKNISAPAEEEIPIITIERDDDGIGAVGREKRKIEKRYYVLLAISLAALFLIVAFLVRKQWQRHTELGVPQSVSVNENIDKLKNYNAPIEQLAIVADSFLFDNNMYDTYKLQGINQSHGGLEARLEIGEPDTADATVVFYSRSADHKADGRYLDKLIIDGKEYKSVGRRYAYMAMANKHIVMGVSKSSRISRYVKKQNGSFFRQYILLSNYAMPAVYDLKGVQYRCAYATTDGNDLLFVRSRQKQRMEDFAIALRNYGFRDAIYITGGDDFSYYRDAQGVRHDIGDVKHYPHHSGQDVIPWLVFRISQ